MSTPESGDPKRLSCVSCRQRKIKCNRVDPCNHCIKAGQKCVFPKPVRVKGGSKMRSVEINKRISRLEGLLRRLNGEAAGEEVVREMRELAEEDLHITAEQHQTQDKLEHDPVIRPDGSSYLGGDLWATLSGEVDGLRQLLDEDSGEEEDERQSASSRSRTTDSQSETVSPFFFNPMNPPMDLRQLHPYPPLITTTFCDIYFSRVDPCFKLLHQPSMRKRLASAAAHLRNLPQDRPFEALMFAFYFATICSLRPDECEKIFCDDKDSLVDRYKRGAEAALANADFLNSNELTSLQALILYVICTRTLSTNRSAWALASLTARIGQALNLHRDEANSAQDPFEAQMRRRAWWMIIMMDSCFCEDRGTPRSFLTPNSFPRMASNVNDEDIWPGMTSEVKSRDGWTEMTYCLLCHEAAIASSVIGRAQAPSATTTEGERRRERSVCEARDRVEEKYLKHCDERIPIQWVAARVARCIISRHFLGVYYPVHTRRVVRRSASIRISLLNAALTSLELGEELEQSENGRPFIWFLMLWSQWFPLAVVLAELCSQTSGPQVERAWRVLTRGFVERWGVRMADGDEGGLWKPLRKLWEKARSVRAATLKEREAAGVGAAILPAPVSNRQNSQGGQRPAWDVAYSSTSGGAVSPSTATLRDSSTSTDSPSTGDIVASMNTNLRNPNIDATLSGMALDPLTTPGMGWPSVDGMFVQPPHSSIASGGGTATMSKSLDLSTELDNLISGELAPMDMDVDNLGPPESWGDWEQFLNGALDEEIP